MTISQDINLTEEQRQQLADLARNSGRPWQNLLAEFIASYKQLPKKSDFSLDRFESDLDTLLHSGPSLPADFSRADIYADHD